MILNSKKLDKLDKLLNPLKEEYARKAWAIARKKYNVGDHEQRRLAFATVNDIAFQSAMVLAGIRPPSTKRMNKKKK